MSLDSDDIYVATAERIFADLADPLTVAHARDDSWVAPLWRALEDNGLTLAMVSEAKGGPGLALDEAMALLRAAGRSALAVPLAETMLANHLLAEAGLDLAEGMAVPLLPTRAGEISIDGDGRVSGHLRDVPFARNAAAFVAVCDGTDGPVVARLDPAECRIEEGTSLAFDPSDAVRLDGVAAIAQGPAPDGDAALLLAATARAQLIAGAMERMLDITVNYATERKAFERTISKFQAVQHLLAELGEETAAGVAAACSAADTLARGDTGEARLLEVAAAKIRCGEAGRRASAIAHQVHGAIGFTAEHPLHRLTLRAQAWGEDFGNESMWAVRLGRMAAQGGADALWPLLSSR